MRIHEAYTYTIHNYYKPKLNLSWQLHLSHNNVVTFLTGETPEPKHFFYWFVIIINDL